ncbi:MAG: valine--tRNA ligase [Candidatus Methanomethylophilaceae archaeon]|jgi:valyl-tRNA synthetase
MSQYDPASIEGRWQQKWKEWEIYRFDPASDRPIYSIDNPPRYTSGSLHLGHATGYSLIDFAARYHRMKGCNVFFPLCFDVNGTPTEVKVEKKHGINKLDLPREEYRRLCSEFANGFIEEMTHHFEILGESMDPSIYYQTDAEYYRRITQISFVKLFHKGLVYKGDFPVNWCPRCMTALADAEVEYRDNVTKLNYIRFRIDGEDEDLLIATTRPELICTCKVVAVHPDDKSKAHLVGRELVTPIYGRKVKVIADPKVDPAYGTGNVMICTIGDKDDLEWVMKYNLPMEKAIDEHGLMTEISGYAGMSVTEARAAIIEDLRQQGLLVKQEDNPQNLSICWRCHTGVEYLQVPQWFLKTLDFKKEVLAKAEQIRWFPEFMKIRLEDWVNSLEWDWILSRQRIFATPIPLWECERCGKAVVAEEEQCYVDPTLDAPPVDSCPDCGGPLKGCTDVFDTWMDSSGSALYNCFWERDDSLFQKMFPMSMRPQSHDIIRTWAFYSILRTHQIADSVPWEDIMIHGFIMSPDGTPMHSSLGNVIDPLPILQEYGADAMRYYACTCSLGIDHAFREKDVVRGRKLCNKLYNIGRFVGRMFDSRPQRPDELRASDRWILSRYSRTVERCTVYLEAYQFDKAMREIESFTWHEFADHYIEMSKGREDQAVRYTLYTVLLGITKLMAPFMPHVTEDVYQDHFRTHEGAQSIHVSEWPQPVLTDAHAEALGESLKQVISAVRAWKSDHKMALNAPLQLVELIGPSAADLEEGRQDIMETVKAMTLNIVAEADIQEKVVGVKPVHARLGPSFKAASKQVIARLAAMDPAEVAEAMHSGGLEVEVDGELLKVSKEHVDFETVLLLDGRQVETLQVNGLLVAIEP